MITHTGLIKTEGVREYNILPQFDQTVYTEPDGTKWIRIFHHNNPASYLFNINDDFAHGVYKDTNRWFNLDICKNMTTCEFLAKQTATSGATEVKCRWIQSKNPWVATYDDVKPTAVTRITTSGYTNNTTYGGGIYNYSTTTNTRFVIANNTSGNWWGATGCWTEYQGGIPGLSGTICKTGYFDIYLKICYNNIETLESKLTLDQIWVAPELIEY